MAPSPRSMASWLNSATLCVPGARYSASASNSALDRGPRPGYPRSRAVPIEEATVGHAVELYHRTRHMLLQRPPRYTASGEGPQRFRHFVGRGDHHVLGPLRVYVTPLDPDFLMIGAQCLELAGGRKRRGARVNERPGERHGAVAQSLDE